MPPRGNDPVRRGKTPALIMARIEGVVLGIYFAVGPDIPMTNAVSSSSKTTNPRLRYDSTIDFARVCSLFGVGPVLLLSAEERAFTDRDLAFVS